MYKLLIVQLFVAYIYCSDYVVCETLDTCELTVKIYENKIGNKPDIEMWFREARDGDEKARGLQSGWIGSRMSDSKDGKGSISSSSGSYSNNVITIKDDLGSIGLISLESRSGEIVLRSGLKILFVVENRKSPNQSPK